MNDKRFKSLDGGRVTDDMLAEAAKLFSENYGVWGEQAAQFMGNFAKAGSRVKLGGQRLRDEYLPSGKSSYGSVFVDGHLAGNTLACCWTANGKTVCWITQLVVHRDYRERGLATTLLNKIKKSGDDLYGIMSSHPAACLAACKAFGSPISTLSFNFIKNNAEAIMKESPIPYIRDAKLRGELFDPQDASGLVTGADTGFYVDHEEPLEALARVRQST